MPNSTVSSTVPPRKGEHMCLGAVRGTAPNDGLSVPPTAAGPKPSPPFLRDEAGIRPCPPAAMADSRRRGTARAPYYLMFLDLGWALSLTIMPCTVRFVAQTTKCRGDSPRTSGGRVCLAAVSFLSPFGWPSWAWGEEAPGSRPVHGSWTAPARIRAGTQGTANPKGDSLKLSVLGGVSGPGRGRFFVLTAARR